MENFLAGDMELGEVSSITTTDTRPYSMLGSDLFVCNFPGCGKIVDTRVRMNDHLRSTHFKRYHCQYHDCGYRAARPCLLRQHEHTVHGMAQKQPMDLTTHVSNITAASTAGTLDLSIPSTSKAKETESNGNPLYSCSLCNVQFKKDAQLKVHVWRDHRNSVKEALGHAHKHPMLVCPICKVGFVRGASLRNHMTKFHVDDEQTAEVLHNLDHQAEHLYVEIVPTTLYKSHHYTAWKRKGEHRQESTDSTGTDRNSTDTCTSDIGDQAESYAHCKDEHTVDLSCRTEADSLEASLKSSVNVSDYLIEDDASNFSVDANFLNLKTQLDVKKDEILNCGSESDEHIAHQPGDNRKQNDADPTSSDARKVNGNDEIISLGNPGHAKKFQNKANHSSVETCNGESFTCTSYDLTNNPHSLSGDFKYAASGQGSGIPSNGSTDHILSLLSDSLLAKSIIPTNSDLFSSVIAKDIESGNGVHRDAHSRNELGENGMGSCEENMAAVESGSHHDQLGASNGGKVHRQSVDDGEEWLKNEDGNMQLQISENEVEMHDTHPALVQSDSDGSTAQSNHPQSDSDHSSPPAAQRKHRRKTCKPQRCIDEELYDADIPFDSDEEVDSKVRQMLLEFDGVDDMALDLCDDDGNGEVSQEDGDSSWRCRFPGCAKWFMDLTELREHQRIHEAIVHCPHENCPRGFYNYGYLRRHILHCHVKPEVRKPANFVTCEKCGLYLKEDYFIKKHSKHCRGTAPLPCTECEKTFAKQSSLTNHMKAHFKSPNKDKKYVCKYEGCKKKFTSSQDLSRHTNVHTGARPYVCRHNGCTKSYKQYGHLLYHMRNSHAKKREPQTYICPFCNNIFNTNHSYTAHIRYHCKQNPDLPREEVGPNKCVWCGEVLENRKMCSIHMKQCQHSMSFELDNPEASADTVDSEVSDLRECHESNKSSHNEESVSPSKKDSKTFVCPYCSNLFTRIHNYTAHIRHRCKLNPNKQKGPSPNECVWCGAFFPNRKICSVHIRDCQESKSVVIPKRFLDGAELQVMEAGLGESETDSGVGTLTLPADVIASASAFTDSLLGGGGLQGTSTDLYRGSGTVDGCLSKTEIKIEKNSDTEEEEHGSDCSNNDNSNPGDPSSGECSSRDIEVKEEPAAMEDIASDTTEEYD